MKIPIHWLKYLSVPSVLLWDERLSYVDCFVFAIVQLLDNEGGCRATNKTIGSLLGGKRGRSSNGQTISNSIGRLCRAGYLESEMKDIKTDDGPRSLRSIRVNYEGLQKNRRKLDRAVDDNEVGEDPFKTTKNIIVDPAPHIMGIITEDNLLSSKEDNRKGSKETEPFLSSSSSLEMFPGRKKRVRKIPMKKEENIPTGKKRRPTLPEKKKPDKDNNKKKHKTTQFERAPTEDRHIILTWNRTGAGRKHSNKDSNLIKQTLKLLPKIRQKHDAEDIVDAIDYHRQFSNNGKISILDFFQLNPFQKRYLQRSNQPLKSPFERILSSPDFRDYNRTKRYPREVYEELTGFYRKHITCEDVEFTEKQENHFKLAAVRLGKYIRERRLEKYVEGCTTWDYVNMLFHALDWWWEDGHYTTANLCSDFTFSDTLPRYLSQEYES